MLKFRIPEIFFGTSLVVCLSAMDIAFSSPQQSSPTTNSQHTQDRSHETNNGQQDEPLWLWHWMTHDAAGFFTLWLVIIGSCQLSLFWVQLKFIRESLTDAKVAADAATEAAKAAGLNARAAINMELPVLLAIAPDLLSINADETMEGAYAATVNEDLPGPHSAIAAIKIQNFGRTPAFPVLIKCGVSVTQTLPNEPVYDRELPRTPAAIIRRDETVYIDIHAPIRLLDLQVAEIKASNASLWFYCSLFYRDFMETCWRWGQDPPGEGMFGFISDSRTPPKYTRNTQNNCAGLSEPP